jgi:hypothetical protein
MADTGYNWDAAWTPIDAAIVLTVGGTITDPSATIDLDGKAACLISIDVDYSDHAKATGGLFFHIQRETGDGSFEAAAYGAWGFEMAFLQNGTVRSTFFLSAGQYQKFQVYLWWKNTTASAVATIRTDIKYATIPVAS